MAAASAFIAFTTRNTLSSSRQVSPRKYHCIGAFVLFVHLYNQEKALVGAFSVIVKTDCEADGSSAALLVRQAAVRPGGCGVVMQ